MNHPYLFASHMVAVLLCLAILVVLEIRRRTKDDIGKRAMSELLRIYTTALTSMVFVLGNAEGKAWQMVCAAICAIFVLTDKTSETISKTKK